MAEPPTVEAGRAEQLDTLVGESFFKPGRITVSAAHLMGGCGMGRTAEDSVTDSYGRVHGIPWLFVADASLFPDAVEINPYLTIMALADRAAERIREEVSTT
jgi:choline dehydrogenase-like flavoprotein